MFDLKRRRIRSTDISMNEIYGKKAGAHSRT
jgi:hypothetical protein